MLTRRLLVLPIVGVSLLTACEADLDGAHDDGDALDVDDATSASLDALVGAQCSETEARRVDVALAEGSECASVEGQRGAWVARPLFPDAPEDIRASSCRFTWRTKPRSPTGSAAPERVALASAVQGVWAPTCAVGRPHVVDATIEAPSIGPSGGSIGCDVCGKNRGRKGWVVIPIRERLGERVKLQVSLATADGVPTSRDVAFSVPLPADASALNVDFPPPPNGLRYVSDSIRVGGF